MKIVIVGAGGHARTVMSILRCYPEIEVNCFVDKESRFEGETISGIPVEDFSILPDILPKGVDSAIIAIGDNFRRERYFAQLRDMGFKMINAIHPSATIDNNTTIGKGVVIAAGAIVCPFVDVGDNTIINTGSIVEHEVRLGENVHVGPGVNIAGRVTIGRNSFIGLGSNIKDYISIGENVIVGAGSVVLEDIADNIIVAGVPARAIKQRK